MSHSLVNRFFYTVISFTLVISSQAGRADDTEIYFSSGGASDETTIRPNVLFILDTSGSMESDLSQDEECPPPVGTGTDCRSRIEVLRSSMSTIIQNIQNVNLGLMRFTYNDGGPVLFPITYIDETLDNVVGADLTDADSSTFDFSRVATQDAEENILGGDGTVTTNNTSGFTLTRNAGSGGVVTATLTGDDDRRIGDKDNDAEEDTDAGGSNNMSGNDVGTRDDTLRIDSNGSMVGLRWTYTPGDIPKCADVTNAYIRLRVQSENSGAQVINIYGQDSDSTSEPTETHEGLTLRPDTGKVFEWDPPGFGGLEDEWTDTTTGVAGGDPLEEVIEEIIQRGCTVPGTENGTGTWDESSIMLFMEQKTGPNFREFRSRDDTRNKAPRLYVDWSINENTTTPVVAQTEKLVALRFEDIDIPQGANVTSASLKINSSADATDGSPDWDIYGELTANAAEFTTTNSDLSDRVAAGITTKATWNNVPDWADNEIVESSDIEVVLQDIVDQGDWCGGNDITIFIESQADGDLRYAHSLETDSNAFELEFSYSSDASDGCFQDSTSKQLEVSQDDAQQDGTNANADINESSIPIAAQTSGFRFNDVFVPQGATIINAEIKFTSIVSTSASTDVVITGELPNDGDADVFEYEVDNITDRLVGDTAGVTWSLPATLAVDQTFTTPTNFKNVVQAIVSDNDWTTGNAMAFLFSPATTGSHAVYSRDGEATKAAKLTITYQSSGSVITKTARDRMVELVEALPSSDHTPIMDVLYEAAHYWRGESIVFGKNRWGDDDSALSHPGSYCSDNGNGTYDCNGATIDGDTNEFGVDYEGGCDPTDENEWLSNDCDNTYIKGSPSYISPISSESTCQNNYQIFLTDGEIYDTDGDQQGEIESEYGLSCYANNSDFKPDDEDALTYTDSPRQYGEDGVQKCAVDLVKFLREQDQIDDSILDNDQIVKTTTVAFDLNNDQFMRDIANQGGGDFYEASSAEDLIGVFESFLEDVRDEPTSFVAPSLATNAFNRLLSRDEVYFGLFTPEFDKRWLGNVKKYRICVDEDDFGGCTLGAIYDDNNNLAIDESSNRFDEDARSVWTDPAIEGGADGVETTKGGAGAEVTDYSGTDGVTIYTEVGGDSASGTKITNGALLNADGYVYKESSSSSDDWADDDLQAMRADVCSTPSQTNNSECETQMKWLLGKKVVGEPDSDISTFQRWTDNDVLHSSPIVITYGGEDTSTPADGSIDVFFDKLVFGTNDGALHFINGSDGTEDWRFIPESLMSQQQEMYDDPSGDHLYGLDVTPVIRIIDHDNNGILETADSDKAYIYQAMRRGGKHIYALDVSGQMSSATTVITPKFYWSIEGGSTPGYHRLDDTWSRPVVADIATSSGKKTVLIFGGGYDDNLDNAAVFGTDATSTNDNNGNAIYIADADDGDKILSIAGENIGGSPCAAAVNCPDIKVANMKYSIPSRVTVLDSDGDGLDDRIYVGDTGGQVWRVDLGNDILASGGITAAGTCEADASCTKTVVGRLASIADSSDTADFRRFFEPPSVVEVSDTQFGSGINNGQYDYVLLGSGYRPHPLNEATQDRFYAFRDLAINGMSSATGTNLAEDYPKASSVPISHSINDELIDITDSTLESEEVDGTNVDNALGWYFDFNTSNTSGGVVTDPGEKVLSAPITIAGTVFFTTYIPSESESSDVCVGAQIGSGFAYNFDILSTKAVIDWDSTGSETAGRKTALGGGIPSDVVPVFTEEGVVGIVGIEGGATQLGSLAGLPRYKTYWYEDI